ncbi:MAG: flagellar biosynthetic protein FliO [Burkholderiaceae bacterium]|jgi:flagellar protein FliO/FliZ|nr:flagellar biosynthetic protein FliO [Burkholderiaceae bacterium]
MRAFYRAVFLFAVALSTVHAETQSAARPAASPVSTVGYLLQGIFALLVVLGLMWGAWWLIRRTGFNRKFSGVKMKVVGGLSIGSRERVMVVEIGDHWLILGVTPNQINTLATMPKQELPEDAAGTDSPPFAAWLKKTMERQKNDDKT